MERTASGGHSLRQEEGIPSPSLQSDEEWSEGTPWTFSTGRETSALLTRVAHL